MKRASQMPIHKSPSEPSVARSRLLGEITMPFGKHKGELVVDLDHGYLRWLYENCDLHGDLKAAVEVMLEADAEDEQWERWGSGYRRRG